MKSYTQQNLQNMKTSKFKVLNLAQKRSILFERLSTILTTHKNMFRLF